MPTNKIIFIDIDGTICSDCKGNYQNAEPYYDKIEIVNNLYKNNKIILWTARGTTTGENWTALTTNQLKKWNVKYHELRFGKPFYDLFIDDKARRSLDEI